MIACGLRPVEICHLSAKPEFAERKALWVSYQKVCGGAKTAALAVDPCWLKDADGEPVKWPLFELIQAGLLELPRRRNGSKRELDSGTSINIYRSVRPAIESIDGSGGS